MTTKIRKKTAKFSHVEAGELPVLATLAATAPTMDARGKLHQSREHGVGKRPRVRATRVRFSRMTCLLKSY
ncbi:MAG TPA: hypothetical protein VMT20_06550 [Terriglobia bacterium]|nr:hypothetical protein [Terriglobia bacterium]